MKYTLFTLLFVAAFSFSQAQITMESDSLVYYSTDSMSEYIFDINVINAGNKEQSVWWKIKRDSLFPAQWELFLCDVNLCYSSSVTQCPASKPSLLPANDTVVFMFHFNPEEIGGLGHTWIELYADKSFKTLLFSTSPNGVLNINRKLTSSVVDVDAGQGDMIAYPNPVNQSINIETSSNYDKVVITDMFGKTVASEKYHDNGSYDCTNVQQGMYIVKIVDNDNKIVGWQKIVKL
jgi:Secretion system C-terminal sorting domain